MGALTYLTVLHVCLLIGYLLVFYGLHFAFPPNYGQLPMPPTKSYPESSWVMTTYNLLSRVRDDHYA